jgi:hypothetical protein
VVSGFDGGTDLIEKRRSQADAYANLPGELAETVRAAYDAAIDQGK